MQKLSMCRICLAKNVPLYGVVNKNLHELYEKLTDIPFVTEDKRPILACFVCCAKLKQCFRFTRKCLEAEQLFYQMMNEPNCLMNPGNLEFCSGFTRSPIEQINIVGKSQPESIAIKVELPADCEALDDVNENQTDEYLEPENVYNSYRDVKDIPPDYSEPDSGGDVPLAVVKTEGEEAIQVSTNKRRAVETNNYLEDVKDIPLEHSESDSDGDVPLKVFKIEVEEEIEVSKKKRGAVETNSTLTKCTFSRMHFFEVWATVRGSVREKHKHIVVGFQDTIRNEKLDIGPLQKRLFDLCKRLNDLWKSVHRTKTILLNKYANWLNVIECVELKISDESCTTTEHTVIQPRTSTTDRVRGRPNTDFFKLSQRSKRRRLTE